MGNKLCKKKNESSEGKSQTPFDRIITRLHLRPNAWKSESHLNQKQITREKPAVSPPQQISKSQDWTDAPLEVPEAEEAIHLRNPKLAIIFDNDTSTPVPPPRKHRKGIREKLEAVAKSGLQALQKKPVEEPPCLKKIINYSCPCDQNHDYCAIHRKSKKDETNQLKRRKNLSVVSLPNYNELKLSVSTFDKSEEDSLVSLPVESKSGKFEIAMTRCRSFGSLLPQQLLDKLKVRKIPIDIESDDSFGPLEDWDLRILEHYNPKDASLPRQTKPLKNKTAVLSNIESLVVQDEEEVPKVPARKSENVTKKVSKESEALPPASGANEEVGHSNLMKILQEFSVKEKDEVKKKIESVRNFLDNEKMYSGGLEGTVKT